MKGLRFFLTLLQNNVIFEQAKKRNYSAIYMGNVSR